jgi:hypothetical protein
MGKGGSAASFANQQNIDPILPISFYPNLRAQQPIHPGVSDIVNKLPYLWLLLFHEKVYLRAVT